MGLLIHRWTATFSRGGETFRHGPLGKPSSNQRVAADCLSSLTAQVLLTCGARIHESSLEPRSHHSRLGIRKSLPALDYKRGGARESSRRGFGTGRARAIQYSSREGENVLDLFGGSGSTLVACEQTGRNAYLMELDPPYCDVIVQRWENLTGKKAERRSAGN